MIDLRYHVYSLAAVIVALAIGFIFGTSSASKRTDVSQVQGISGRYERALTGLKSDIETQEGRLRTARGDLSRSEKLCSELIPIVLKDRLPYRNVAIIQTGDYDDLTANLKAAIHSAGGTVTSVTKIPASFDITDAAAVADTVDYADIAPKPGESMRIALLRVIAESVFGISPEDKLSHLEDRHVVSLYGDYDRWNRFIVIVGGSASKDADHASIIDVPLIEQIEDLGASVVACEPAEAVSSCVPTWQRTEAATVDNADTPCGRAALICALAGEKAHFGQKRSADRLLPETLGGTR